MYELAGKIGILEYIWIIVLHTIIKYNLNNTIILILVCSLARCIDLGRIYLNNKNKIHIVHNTLNLYILNIK